MRCPDWRIGRWRSCAARRASAASTSSRSTATATCRAHIREGEADGPPYLAIDDCTAWSRMAQMSAIELHAWGATEADPLHPDQLVFDLDPGEGVAFAEVVDAPRSTCATGWRRSG